MNEQILGSTGHLSLMSGFATNYATQPPSKDGPFLARNAMHFFTPTQVPVISALAKAFGVSDRWHASAPCQTWPNRFFTHTATARGHVDNNTFLVPFISESIFHRLSKANVPWRVYFHDMPQAILLGDLWLSAIFHFRRFEQFLADADSGNLPSYSFIEPRYFSDLFLNRISNDEHPPHDVSYGEQLVASVYNAVRASPCWKRTLLIITYDEHGGCYDHVPPPSAKAPDALVNNKYGYQFDTYGVRVPAVIISPYVPPGSKIRPTPNAVDGITYPFDHTSIISTVRELFTPGAAPLTNRDRVAPSLLSALSLPGPDNDGPPSIDGGHNQPTPGEVQERADASPNDLHQSLAAASAMLPTAPLTSQSDVPAPAAMPPIDHPTVAIAQANATARTALFLDG
jgi:phospholipase C